LRRGKPVNNQTPLQDIIRQAVEADTEASRMFLDSIEVETESLQEPDELEMFDDLATDQI
jgi:hypothetical protein